MDLYNMGVDPTILRSILLRRRLKKYPRVLHRPPISQNPIPLAGKVGQLKSPVSLRKPLRNKAVRKPEISPELQKELQTSSYPQYCWEISAAKRKKNAVVREELGEINPYSHPVEGVRHNLRNLVDPVAKLIAKKQLTLPVDKKHSLKVKRQLKAKAIVNKIYKETEPKEGFVEKFQPFPKPLETTTPLEYHLTWKEIEMCKIMCQLKITEVDNINKTLMQQESQLRKHSIAVKEAAASMEATISEYEKDLYNVLRQFVIEKDLTRQKSQQVEELAEQLGLLKHQIYFLMTRLDELRVYGMFLFNMSPYEWRQEQRKMLNVATDFEDKFSRNSEIFDDSDSLEDLITKKLKKPTLYFQSPEEFMSFFTELETVNFVIYSHSKVITNFAEAGTYYAKELTDRYNVELEILREMAEELNRSIVWEENHVELLKNFCSKYIFTDFMALVYELENVKLAVENTYNDVLTTNDLNLGAAALMKEIELQIVHLTESANPSNPETIKLTKMMNQESRMREVAQRRFEKTFREYELLLKELKRSFEFEKGEPRRKLMERSSPNVRAADVERLTVEEKVHHENFAYFRDDAYPCRS